jgi:peptidoglycan/LPS O-acetylase OafA/YrhL
MWVGILSASNKIIFANQLRGIAAILVVLSHICGAFWSVRDVVGYYSGTPPVTGEQPFIAGYISNQYLNFGAFGVAVFFMISGFVIPMSLGRVSKARFLIGRLLRIYPTYIAAFSVGMLAVWLSCMYWGKAFMWNYQALLSNMFLVHTFTDLGSIDLVNWTLAVELKFYIVVCLMGGLVVAGRVWPLLAFSLIIFCLNKFTKSYIGIELMFVSFMMMGVLFNYLFRGLINVFVCSAACLWIMSLFLIGWESGGVSQNYVYGFTLFAVAYALREKFVNIRILDFFADISYPLYVVHSLVAYGVMRVLLEHGLPTVVVVPFAAVCVVSIAYSLHVLVEKPTMHLGKKIRQPGKLVTA